MSAPEVPPARAEELRRASAVLVDVRRDDEFRAEHVPGSLHLPLDVLAARAGELPDGPLVLVCRSGDRSAMAADALAGAGRDAVSLAGGVTAWARAGLPLEKA